jgi:hypothetical protein
MQENMVISIVPYSQAKDHVGHFQACFIDDFIGCVLSQFKEMRPEIFFKHKAEQFLEVGL